MINLKKNYIKNLLKKILFISFTNTTKKKKFIKLYQKNLNKFLFKNRIFKYFWLNWTYKDNFLKKLSFLKGFLIRKLPLKNNNNLNHFLIDSRYFVTLNFCRFYCYIGSHRSIFNSYFKVFSWGFYNNLAVLNLGKGILIFKLMLNIFLKYFFFYLKTSSFLIFNEKLRVKTLLKLGCNFGNNYYLHEWVFGTLTNRQCRLHNLFKEVGFELEFYKGGPLFFFFTGFFSNLHKSYILKEFKNFDIPTFGMLDSGFDLMYTPEFIIPLNARNMSPRVFYLLVISKLYFKVKNVQHNYWLNKLQKFLTKFFLIKKNLVKKEQIFKNAYNYKEVNWLEKKSSFFKKWVSKFYYEKNLLDKNNKLFQYLNYKKKKKISKYWKNKGIKKKLFKKKYKKK